MRDILVKLNKMQGVRGSMVVGRDGIVVASDFGEAVNEELLGAIASQLLAALTHALERINSGKLTRFVVTGSEYKLALVDAGSAVLLVLMQRELNTSLINLEIKQAVAAVIQSTKI